MSNYTIVLGFGFGLFALNLALWAYHSLRYRDLKSRLGFSSSSILLSQDLTHSVKGYYWYKGIVGKPDVVIAQPLFGLYCIPIYRKIAIIDIKSRDGYEPTLYEAYQMNLYHLIVSKNLFSISYSIAIMYANHYQTLQPDKSLQRKLLLKKQELIKIQRKM